jgi:hypothetical protein
MKISILIGRGGGDDSFSEFVEGKGILPFQRSSLRELKNGLD